MFTLDGASQREETIRQSRFTAHAAAVRTQAESLAFYEAVADPQATHNCWAWRIGLQCRFNDDGEPSGSAGRPILAAIEGRQLDRVMVVVSRHFGGIKLGIGGLIRAYGGCAAKCLDDAAIIPLVPMASCAVETEFALAETLHQLLNRFGAEKQQETYAGHGIRLQIRLPENHLEAFTAALTEASRGQARVRKN